MDHMEVVTAFLNCKLDADDINMTMAEGWPKVINTPKMMVMFSKALYSLQHAAQL
jgi:hypothetical protein